MPDLNSFAVPLPCSRPFYAVAVSDSGDGLGPILLETLISDSSLESALQRRNRFGTDWGSTYIAECRIIPNLTHHA